MPGDPLQAVELGAKIADDVVHAVAPTLADRMASELPEVFGPGHAMSVEGGDFLHEQLIEYQYLMDDFRASGRSPMALNLDILDEQERLTREYGFSLLDENALAKVVGAGRQAPIVDYGAGNGYLSHLLQERGVEVHSYDIAPPETGGNIDFPEGTIWTPVQKADVSVLAGHGDSTLLLGSPPPEEPMAADALAHYPGNRLIYIGEGRGGYTADDRFFDTLDSHWHLQSSEHLPTFPSQPRVWPELRIYQRQSA